MRTPAVLACGAQHILCSPSVGASSLGVPPRRRVYPSMGGDTGFGVERLILPYNFTEAERSIMVSLIFSYLRRILPLAASPRRARSFLLLCSSTESMCPSTESMPRSAPLLGEAKGGAPPSACAAHPPPASLPPHLWVFIPRSPEVPQPPLTGGEHLVNRGRDVGDGGEGAPPPLTGGEHLVNRGGGMHPLLTPSVGSRRSAAPPIHPKGDGRREPLL